MVLTFLAAATLLATVLLWTGPGAGRCRRHRRRALPSTHPRRLAVRPPRRFEPVVAGIGVVSVHAKAAPRTPSPRPTGRNGGAATPGPVTPSDGAAPPADGAAPADTAARADEATADGRSRSRSDEEIMLEPEVRTAVEEAERVQAAAEEAADDIRHSARKEAEELRAKAADDLDRADRLLAWAEMRARHTIDDGRVGARTLMENARVEAERRLDAEALTSRVRVRRFDVSAVLAVMARELVVFLHTWRTTTFSSLVEPTIFLLAFGLGIGALIKRVQGVDYIQFVGTGVVATTVVFGSAFPAMFTSFVKRRFQRLYDSILSTPINVPELVTAEVLWIALRTAVFSLAPIVVAIGFGLQPSWGMLAVPGIAFLTALGFAGFGIAIAAKAKAITSFNYVISGLLTPLLLVAGAYFPVSNLPRWAFIADQFNPLYHCVALVRHAVFGFRGRIELYHVAALLVFAVLTLVLAIKRLRPQLID